MTDATRIDVQQDEGASAKQLARISSRFSSALTLNYRFRWQTGQKWLERFMNFSRMIGVPQRLHGCPASP